jgi:hypothetical protein
MSIRLRVGVIAVWVLSLVAAGVFASAQSQTGTPTVLAGDEVGFRIERWQGKTPVGTLVVKINGEWVDVQFATKAHFLR